MDTAQRENRANVESEVLARLHTFDPGAFERLVLKVLSAMGYGGRTGAVEHTGRSGDGGIDGIIRQDPLGLDRVYLQAKRYAADNSVGRPALQAFVGALHGQQADRGVLITTSVFSKDAAQYVGYLRERIVLIDGQELAKLIVVNVGIRTVHLRPQADGRGLLRKHLVVCRARAGISIPSEISTRRFSTIDPSAAQTEGRQCASVARAPSLRPSHRLRS